LSDLLSQEEVDSLLQTIDRKEATGAPETDGAGPKNVSKHDFRRPARASGEQMRMLQEIHKAYADSLSIALSPHLMGTIDIGLVALEELACSEFTSQLQLPTCLNILNIAGSNHNILFEIHPDLAFAMIEKMLGGSGSPPEAPRAFTAIEAAILRQLLNVMIKELSRSWATVQVIEIVLDSSEMGSDFGQVAAPDDSVLLATLEVKLGSVAGTLNICLPFDTLSVLLPQPEALEEAKENDLTGREKSAMQNSMLGAPVVLNATLGKARLTVRELLRLTPGDVIILGDGTRTECAIAIAGRPKFSGRPGLVGRKLAILVTGPADPAARSSNG